MTATSRAWKLSIPRCNCSKVKKMGIPSAYRGGNTALWGDPCYTRQYADTRGFIKREGAVDNGQVTSADMWRCVQSNKQPLEWVDDASCATVCCMFLKTTLFWQMNELSGQNRIQMNQTADPIRTGIWSPHTSVFPCWAVVDVVGPQQQIQARPVF